MRTKGDRTDLEILLAPDEVEAGLRVHVALDVERRTENFGPAEEDTGFGRCMDLADRLENHVPVGATEVGRRTQAGNGILFSVGVVDHNVGSIVGFDLGSEVLCNVSYDGGVGRREQLTV